MTTNHKRAWGLFEKRRRAAVEGFEYLDADESAVSEEGIFVKVMEEVYGPAKRVPKSDERMPGVHP